MKLHIENICKIACADIALNGITIITGNNNTGKSTVGKTLWTMFDALSDLKGKAENERLSRCKRILLQFAPEVFRNRYSSNLNAIAQKLVNGEISVNDALDSFSKPQMPSPDAELAKSDVGLIRKALDELLSIDDKKLKSQIVLNRFNWVFAGQFAPIGQSNAVPTVKMTIKGKELSVSFEDEFPTVVTELELQNRPYLFDSPNMLDPSERLFNYIHDLQLQRIKNSFRFHEDTENYALERILLRKRFDEINSRISDTIGGSVIYNKNNDFQFAASDLPQKLNLENLSKGIKAMAVLQAAFSNGMIKERDVLILDEPEIHLHPDWQIKYAEFIVLLQKAFNLTVLLTTHSPDFVQAIRLYSDYHGLEGSLNAYVSDADESGSVTMHEIPQDDWDEVFAKFATGFDFLMKLRSDLEDKRNG